jgi:hypothetical protein
MRKANVKLLSMDGSYTVKWLCVGEAQRLIDKGSARRVSKPRELPIRIQLVEVAKPSSSPNSKVMLNRGDAALLAGLKPGFVERLDTTALQNMSPSTIACLQRLSGWNLLPRNKVLENYAPEA